jgi:hypothetical protein
MRMLFLFLVAGTLSACSTQHLKASASADAVASCIATRWENCAAPGFKLPVRKEKQAAGYFVGTSIGSMYFGLPSGAKHSNYPVWAEVTETAQGSETEYRKAFQFSSACIDKVVYECQEATKAGR